MADNEFGYTAWGRDWVRLAEPLSQTRPEPLLPRARRIARNGGVTLEIEGRMVRASIHRGMQASVTYLEIAALPAATSAAVSEQIATATVELADTVHERLRGAGISFAPRLHSTDCSCSARTPRCLHHLATCYALAAAVDENPWLALDLQGYRDAGCASADTESPPPRWTPIDTLDPARFFDVASAAGAQV